MQTGQIANQTDIRFLFVGFVLLLLCPVLSVPFIIYGIYYRKKGSFAALSLLLGVFAFISAPSGDLYRHYCQYNYFSIRPLSAITWTDISLNGILPYLYWSMSHLNISFSYLRFFELSTGFYLLCCIFNYMIDSSEGKYSNNDIFIRFVILFLFFDFLYTTMGVKFGFALCTYLYSMHMIINRKNRIVGCIFFIFTCIWHSSFIFTGSLVYAIYILKPNKNTAIYLCSILAIILPIIISLIGYFLFGRRFDFYFSGKADDVTSYHAMTTIGFVLYILPKLTIIPFALILIKKYNKESRWCRIALGWFMLSIIFITNAVTFYRFWWAFMTIGIFFLLDMEKLSVCFSKYQIRNLFVCGLLFTALNMIVYHNEIIYSQYYRSLYPIPLVMSSDYSKTWVYSHIKHDGDF